jgi:ATP sulfurylase/adenylyl-sulfate kinase
MQQGFVVWLTGLSGAGKSTIAQEVAAELRGVGLPVEVLDGDVVRQRLSQGLGFSRADRDENIRRIGFVANLLARNGTAVVVAAISPFREAREQARSEIGRFIEVYVECSLDELVRRDTKGLYAKALKGEIANFTGVSDPYEAPTAPEVTVDTGTEAVTESVAKVLYAIHQAGYGPQTSPPAVEGVRKRASADEISASGSHHLHGHANSTDGATAERLQVEQAQLVAIVPHGGLLVNRLAGRDEVDDWRNRARHLRSVTLTSRQESDVEMIGIGGFSPLTGFLGARDYHSVIDHMRLASGAIWPIPVTLSVSEEEASSLSVGQPIALRAADDRLVAVMYLEEKHRADSEREAQHVYRTTDPAHPGVAVVLQQGPVLLAGPITLIERPASQFPAYQLDPAVTRAAFASRGWRRVVGFQTRNPVHRAHEYIQKAALETMDGLLLHPLVGETKSDDIPADVRMRCYEVLLERYFPAGRTLLAINPAAMRYAGPREAVLHAIVRQNYGCSHFIVGRDHAGVGSYYGTYDAQRIFDEFGRGELGITPLFFDNTFYCHSCAGLVSIKTCPHDPTQHLSLSGTQVRQALSRGEALPGEFSRPEVAAVLLDWTKQTERGGMRGQEQGQWQRESVRV